MKAIIDMVVPLAQYATIAEDKTLCDALFALENSQAKFDQARYRHRSILVNDATGRVVGQINYWDIIKCLEPKYDGLLKSVAKSAAGVNKKDILEYIAKMSLWKDPLEDICKKSATLKAKDIMHTPKPLQCIGENAALAEALHQMTVGQYQSLLVTRNEEIVGILRLTDVIAMITEQVEACSI